MVLNATFNNISAISWQSGLLVEDIRVSGKNHWPVASHWQTLSHILLYRVHLPWSGFKLTTLMVIDTDCIGSFKSNYHTIMTMICSVSIVNLVVSITQVWPAVGYRQWSFLWWKISQFFFSNNETRTIYLNTKKKISLRIRMPQMFYNAAIIESVHTICTSRHNTILI